MARMVVSVFDTRRHADAARQRLLENGFADAQVRVEGRESKPPPSPTERFAHAAEPGVAGVIERMFSGLLLDNDAARYAHAAKYGKSVVALYVPDDAAAQKAASILDAVSGEIGHPVVSDDVAAPPSSTGAEGGSAADPTATLARPRVYPLPNSPTGWGEATRGAKSAIDVLGDPARPQGAIEDAHGLGTDATDDVLRARKAARHGKDQTGK